MSSNNGFASASLGSNTVGASNTSTSAVRSRPRRLVSFMDDENDDPVNRTSNSARNDAQPFASGLSTTLSTDAGVARSRGATPSPLSSRGPSPLPKKHPSRVREPAGHILNEAASLGWNRSSKASSSLGATDFLDSSWSSLQSLASSVLGSDTGRNTPNNTAKTNSRRKPSRSDLYIRSIPRSSPSAWGPSAPASPEIGTGTKEERQALVQAKKREALLLADSDPITSRNFHKRRDSGDYLDQPLDPENEEEALAYIHPVQATDSITGVTIRYGCQAAIFRKANGFWPNDNIQSRKTVLLPVDACTVKGMPIRSNDGVDLLGTDSEDDNGSSIAPPASAPNGTSSEPTTAASCDTEANRIWKHEKWVQIDGFPAAIEIGRVPRKALGFFPRTRRKSVSYSDADPLSGSSRDPTRTASPGSPQLASSQEFLPRIRPRGDHSKPSGAHSARPQHRRQRSSIHLSGTGVGTLDPTSTGPGPAMDGLSKFFSQHMPQLAPPPVPENLRRSSFGSESTVTSNASTGLENIGGALEGWMRKVAIRAKAGLNELQQGPPNQQASGRGRSPGLWGVGGDLIELDDASEGGRSPSRSRGAARRSGLQGTSSSSSSLRVAPSTSATSRSRATGLDSGSGSSGYGARVKDD
ncbi:hypothetical protein N7492_009580 [Penicillium capsulatum]|uniref:LysM domain-containing protein n=1 Tax=Penicillium capsulatum TaxID=69766 RepID=A0A9W9LI82_9EURO|nr:hypothetical protein N7492_009580 [Penicillium capsulatum]KAJ6106968.1 hypothetical protein N7512_010485 [Penicillium capsulatum]